MKECRHPNICLFIGLSRAPDPDNFISEFIETRSNPSHDASGCPLPRTSRALAYLQARKCIHRDLKGENLLVTANSRLKITDFEFARIAARNEEESQRLTFCGTDSYMSPEILVGDKFDLLTDIFSLGIIFCEIAARKLADDSHFKRTPLSFGIDPGEVRSLASPGCPPDFLQLCLDCLEIEPANRPTTRDILERLRAIEAEILLRPMEGDDTNAGSVRFIFGGKRPPAGRIPSFGVGVGKDIKGSSTDESDDELIEAVLGLSTIKLNSDMSSSTSLSPVLPETPPSASPSPGASFNGSALGREDPDPLDTESLLSIASLDSYRTAASSGVVSPPEATSGSNPLEIFFSSGSFVSKCDLCAKGFGWKPMLECDDCGLRTHGKCGEVAPTRMWYRPTSSRFSTQCHITISRVKQNAANASEGGKPKSSR
ncbi:hypothetical protein K443DRAFT_671349 [Laccaria amethystina LaAM-08-1]|uniref:Protein kinase domain-containing protein n=1 Tax=Laccaria amethystina LaAM-08-1 TaxID=1095629 RepID=A0A0C9XWP8_9AGAR|nr:hypothetical protein K443DRAFT_671349 [Laccaria amethystina LaAM-08-1]